MPFTGLTLGGFLQPSVARSLIEVQANIDKGLCQRFLWLAPERIIADVDQLQKPNSNFVNTIGRYFIANINIHFM